MLTPASQLLEKHHDLLASGKTIIVDPIAAESFDCSLWHNTDIWSFRQQKFSTPFTQYIYPNKPESTYQNIIIFYPKSKDKLPALLSLITSMCTEQTNLFFVGDNKGGIKSIKKSASGYFKYINKVASGKHCLLFQAGLDVSTTEPSLSFDNFQFNINQQPHPVASLPGVFCHGRLDEGTQLLLESLPPNINGDILDFACGCGVIGSYIGKYFTNTKLTLLDIDAFAIESAKETIKLNKLSAHCALNDGLSKISDKFNWIFTNPPFHTGVKIDYDTSIGFFKQCKQNLKSGGQLVVVANSFLKYQPILAKQFNNVRVLSENTKFKVYICS